MKTYNEVIQCLDSFVSYEKIGFDNIKTDFDLDKLRKVLEKLNDPQKNFRAVHIAGTKGKGSVCTFVSSILREGGYRTGLFTSPHLQNISERIRVNSDNITERETVEVFERLERCLGHDMFNDFTCFEVYTLMAITYFSLKNVDIAVFETGLGGRLDATNIINAEVCGITPISYDHMAVLGNSLEEIAYEKTGIIKRGSLCVSAAQNEKVLDVIKEKCDERSAKLSLVGRDITSDLKRSDISGSLIDIYSGEKSYKECCIHMIGVFQVENCVMATSICEKVSDKISEDAVKRGIEKAFIPGRMEVLSQSPTILIDGAQNGDSVGKLKSSVEQIFKYDKLILLLGVSKDKDIKNICGEMGTLADEVIITRSSSERALDPLIIRGYLKGKNALVTYNSEEALGRAFDSAGENDLILVAGSFYLIGEIREKILGGTELESQVVKGAKS